MTRLCIDHYIKLLAKHHSADHQHLALLRHTLCPSVAAMAESWRCRRCWKVLSGKHSHCPHYGGRWDRVQDVSFQPPERRGPDRPPSQGRGKSPHVRNVQWNGNQNRQQSQAERGRSGSASGRKRKPRSKKTTEQRTTSICSAYDASSMEPVWKHLQGSPKFFRDWRDECRGASRNDVCTSNCIYRSTGHARQCQEDVRQVRGQDHRATPEGDAPYYGHHQQVEEAATSTTRRTQSASQDIASPG